jgi:adenine-specific DNA-methyltransferase
MRFIGSKVLLLEEIEKVVQNNISEAASFCDIFSGTSAVARYFKKDFKIISNDQLYFSYVLQKATVENENYPDFTKIKEIVKIDPFDYFNTLKITKNRIKEMPFIYENYSPNRKSDRQYLSNENALIIDFVRQTIEEWWENGLLEENGYYYLLAGLIEAIPSVSNIAGTYGAFLKHWDKRASKRLKMVKLSTLENKKDNQSFNLDSNKLIKKISGDILYIDPPYNTRQYVTNYHLLETISRYDNPDIYGKTGLRPYKNVKSKYCLKKEVLTAFSDLINNANFKHIIVSYSTEGIMSINDIKSVLMENGNKATYKLKKIAYRRYKHRAGYVDHNLQELLFYIAKDK